MKKTNLIFTLLLAIILIALLAAGCGDDSTNNNNNNGGTPPTITMTNGAVYSMNVDSIQSNGTYDSTRYKTTMTYAGSGNVFQITSVTQDSTGGPAATDTFSVKYEDGKFYQYGTLQLIDPNIPATWDLVADYNVSYGTEWTIATNVPISFVPGGTANIRGKVAEETSFTTYGWGNLNVHCYRSEITADIFVSGSPIGTVILDYYIGDETPASNPSGLVRLKLRPFTLLIVPYPGFDTKMQKWTP